MTISPPITPIRFLKCSILLFGAHKKRAISPFNLYADLWRYPMETRLNSATVRPFETLSRY
jgi:hypothetical protein